MLGLIVFNYRFSSKIEGKKTGKSNSSVDLDICYKDKWISVEEVSGDPVKKSQRTLQLRHWFYGRCSLTVHNCTSIRRLQVRWPCKIAHELLLFGSHCFSQESHSQKLNFCSYWNLCNLQEIWIFFHIIWVRNGKDLLRYRKSCAGYN